MYHAPCAGRSCIRNRAGRELRECSPPAPPAPSETPPATPATPALERQAPPFPGDTENTRCAPYASCTASRNCAGTVVGMPCYSCKPRPAVVASGLLNRRRAEQRSPGPAVHFTRASNRGRGGRRSSTETRSARQRLPFSLARFTLPPSASTRSERGPQPPVSRFDYLARPSHKRRRERPVHYSHLPRARNTSSAMTKSVSASIPIPIASVNSIVSPPILPNPALPPSLAASAGDSSAVWSKHPYPHP